MRDREPRLEWLVATVAALISGVILYAVGARWELVTWGAVLSGSIGWYLSHRAVVQASTASLVNGVRRAASELGVNLKVEEAARLLSTSAVAIGMYRYVVASDDGRWVSLRLEHFPDPPDVAGADGGG